MGKSISYFWPETKCQFYSSKTLDFLESFLSIFSSLSSESVLSTPWTSGSDNAWSKMQSECRQLSDQFSTLGDRALTQAENEARGFAEGAHLFLDLLKAYQVRETKEEDLMLSLLLGFMHTTRETCPSQAPEGTC